jgi:predicted dehydrogenase
MVLNAYRAKETDDKAGAAMAVWIDAILENRPVSPDFYDGFKVQEVIDAALESHGSKRRISLGPGP